MPENFQSLEKPPLVSVVITTFNSERYLRETLDGVMAQTYRPIEVIVVDNLSSDRTAEIARSYGDRVDFVQMEKPTPLLGPTRNIGMRRSRGKYLAFLDSDDTWYPEKLAKQVAFMEAHPDVALCHTYVHVIDAQSRVQFVRHEGRMPPTGMCHRELLQHCFITYSSVMVRRSVIAEEGIEFPCDPRKDQKGEEHLFFLLITKRHPVGLVDEVLAGYRRYGESAGDRMGWRVVPENPLVHKTILECPIYWEGVVPRSEVRDIFVRACVANCIHWRDRGAWRRSLYFPALALAKAPLDGRVWNQLARSVFKALASGVGRADPEKGRHER